MTWTNVNKETDSLTAGEIERLLMTYDRGTVRLIAECRDLAEQLRLIELWNDPLGLGQFAKRTSDAA